MCTAAAYRTKDHYFGRNLDLEYTYCETVTITPRNFPLPYRLAGEMHSHYAMIGMAHVSDHYPLYYDATNEKGLSIAGLNFPGNAVYHAEKPDYDNLAPFELTPWLLGQCATMADVRQKLQRLQLVQIPFSASLPLTPMHWLISDRECSLVVESMQDGLHIYDNPVGVLTNNPPFPCQMFYLNHWMGLSDETPENRLCPAVDLRPYCSGMSAIGLPGDLSSASRFVRAAFIKQHSLSGGSESESVSQFFHILESVAQPRGCNLVRPAQYEITQYTSCCNTDKGIYYYTTYENRQITGVCLFNENLDGSKLISYPLVTGQQIRMQN